jgi:uncharacterized phage protein gp47/JayE
MNLNLRPFATLVSNFAVAVQSAYAGLSNFTEGSINLAFGEASASAGLWLQALAFKLQLYARAATCFGEDLDSWVNQFEVYRLGAVAAYGSVTFNRFSALAAATFVPVGTLVQTADGSQIFAVIADDALPTWDAINNGYTIALGVTSVSLPVMSTSAGSSGNVAAGLIAQMSGTSVSAIDYVSNPAAMSGGADAETDIALRARFIAFINSLSKGTVGAVGYAILSLQLGVNYSVVEFQSYADPTVTIPAYFYVVIDDGTGAPPSSLLASAWAAVNAVRAAGVQFSIFGPTVTPVTVAATIAIAPGYDGPTVIGQVYQAIYTFVNELPLGAGLDYLRLAQIAYDASPGVSSVTGLLLNGGVSSIAGSKISVIKSSSIGVA